MIAPEDHAELISTSARKGDLRERAYPAMVERAARRRSRVTSA